MTEDNMNSFVNIIAKTGRHKSGNKQTGASMKKKEVQDYIEM